MAIQIVRSAIDRGITFMDNSWDYHNGGSEIRMGKALRDGFRNRVFLMTKIDGRTRKEAAKQIDESLSRLLRELRPGTTMESRCRAVVSQRLRDSPQLLGESVVAAIDHKTEGRRLLASFVLDSAQPDSESIFALILRLSSAAPEVRAELMPRLFSHIRRVFRSTA